MFNNFQKLNAAILFICLIMVAGSFYLQYGLELEPCPLCILNRISVMILTVVTLFVVCFPIKKVIYQKIIGLISSTLALSGLGVAIRHVYLQNLPPEAIPDCGPGFDYLIESFSLTQALTMILKGSGQCSEIAFQLLGVSLAEWTAISFFILSLLTLWLLINKFHS